MTSPRRLLVASLAALVTVAGCSNSESVQASGPTTSSTGGAPSTTAASIVLGDDESSTTVTGGRGKPGGGAGIGAQVGRLTPEAGSSLMSQVGQATTAADTGSFHVTMAVDDATDHPGHVDLMDIEGAYDHTTGASRSTIDLSGLAAVDPDSLGEDAALFDEPIETIQIGGTAYLKVPGLTDALGGWLKTTGDDTTSGVKPLLDMFRIEDITDFLASLKAAGDVTEVGTEDVAGVSTTHYHADIDPSRLDVGANPGGLLGSLGDAEEAVVDVWIDDDALVHRVQIVADADALGADLAKAFAGGQATLVLEMSDLGAPAGIEAPPPDEVVDLNGGLGDDLTTTEP